MKEMILDEGLKLAEIIHDDCTTISKFISEVVSFIIIIILKYEPRFEHAYIDVYYALGIYIYSDAGEW